MRLDPSKNLNDKVNRLSKELKQEAGKVVQPLDLIKDEENSKKNRDTYFAWMEKRGQLAEAHYELYLQLKKTYSSSAANHLYQSHKLGYCKATKDLFDSNRQEDTYEGAVEFRNKLETTYNEPGHNNNVQQDDKQLLEMGLKALTGIGLHCNKKLANEYFTEAAKQGNVDALYLLAKYEDAAAKEHSVAQYQLGMSCLQTKKYNQAKYWLEKAANHGDPVAQHQLACLAQESNNLRVFQDYSAISLLLTFASAKQGYTEAQVEMGEAFLNKFEYDINEKHVANPADCEMAIQYFKKAAEENSSAAEYYLGHIYKNHSRKMPEAIKWLRLAADHGHKKAKTQIQEIYNLSVNGVPHGFQYSPEQALEIRKDCGRVSFDLEPKAKLRHAAEGGCVSAKYHYEMTCLFKNGVTKLLCEKPNEFLKLLLEDPIIKDYERNSWLEKLSHEQIRKQNRFENAQSYNNRPMLSDDNLIILIQKRYGLLAKNNSKERAEQLQQLLQKFQENNPGHEEAEPILKHINSILKPQQVKLTHKEIKYCSDALIRFNNAETIEQQNHCLEDEYAYILNDKNPIKSLLAFFALTKDETKKEECLLRLKQLDVEKEDVHEAIQLASKSAAKHKNALIEYCTDTFNNLKNAKTDEQKADLLTKELTKIGKDKYAIKPLLAYSILTQNNEDKQASCKLVLKALDVEEKEANEIINSARTNAKM